MKKIVSIRLKLIKNTMLLISVIFLIVLSGIITINIIYQNKNIQNSKLFIKDALVTKGVTLVANNGIAMIGMREDNAFSAIQSLVSSTIKNDRDLVYGIFTDQNRLPWVYATKDNPASEMEKNDALSDSMSLWASALKEQSYKTHLCNKDEIIEFASPVISSDGEILGVIRYGISTKSMQESIAIALSNGRSASNQTIELLILLCILSLGGGYFMVKKLAIAITKPLGSLVQSSKIIAEGNYDAKVCSESNDEIGDLADHFECMRSTIKQYTDHLQDIIDEKMQQVNDILNNIDQGLFTINYDGMVNQEFSARTNAILKVNSIYQYDVFKLFRLNSNQKNNFQKWLDLVQKKHKSQRWEKLVRLSPVQELELMGQDPDGKSLEYVSISYQKVLDKQGNLSKIMVLAMDETEKRLKNQQIAEEKLKHENEVKSILGIANTPQEEIAEFMEDTLSRLRQLTEGVDLHHKRVIEQRVKYPNSPDYVIPEESLDAMYRDMHTIKGNGGSYGFEFLSVQAHQAESLLELLRAPVKTRRSDVLASLKTYLTKMDESVEEIQQKIQLVFGKEEEISIRVPEPRIKKIHDLCNKLLKSSTASVDSQELISECVMLSWKPIKTLTKKYQKIAQKSARKLGKNIDFIVNDELSYFAPDTFFDIDDALIHLIRNAVDHGVEQPDVREELNKGIGIVKLEFSIKDGNRCIVVSDDGKGIDIEKLVESGISKNIITNDDVAAMSDKDKLMLMFRSGVSTAETLTDISGRGMGMNIVQEKIRILGGTIDIATVLGKGTEITLVVPIKETIAKGIYYAAC